MSQYHYDPAQVQAALAKSQGGLPGLGAIWYPQPGVHLVRLGPAYKPNFGMSYEMRKVHGGLFFSSDIQPPLCLAELNQWCPTCAWQRQFRDDPQLGELAKRRWANRIGWAQVIVKGREHEGWLPWKINRDTDAALMPLINHYKDLADPQTGRWLQVTVTKKGKWTDVSSIITYSPGPDPLPQADAWMAAMKNLDKAWHTISAEEMQKLLAQGMPMGGQGGFNQATGQTPQIGGPPGGYQPAAPGAAPGGYGPPAQQPQYNPPAPNYAPPGPPPQQFAPPQPGPGTYPPPAPPQGGYAPPPPNVQAPAQVASPPPPPPGYAPPGAAPGYPPVVAAPQFAPPAPPPQQGYNPPAPSYAPPAQQPQYNPPAPSYAPPAPTYAPPGPPAPGYAPQGPPPQHPYPGGQQQYVPPQQYGQPPPQMPSAQPYAQGTMPPGPMNEVDAEIAALQQSVGGKPPGQA